MERGAWHLVNQHGTGPPGGLVLQRSVVVIARNDNHVCHDGNRGAAWCAVSMPPSIPPSMNRPHPLVMSDPANRIRPWACCIAGRCRERNPVACMGQVSPDSGFTDSLLELLVAGRTLRDLCRCARERAEGHWHGRRWRVIARPLFAALDGLVLECLAA